MVDTQGYGDRGIRIPGVVTCVKCRQSVDKDFAIERIHIPADTVEYECESCYFALVFAEMEKRGFQGVGPDE